MIKKNEVIGTGRRSGSRRHRADNRCTVIRRRAKDDTALREAVNVRPVNTRRDRESRGELALLRDRLTSITIYCKEFQLMARAT